MQVQLRFLGKGGSPTQQCPSLYETDRGSFLVQGWITDQLGTIEIPHLLLGFVEPDTFIGAAMRDTGRGTFNLSGQPVTDPEVLARLELAENETVIEVPRRERTFYGAAA
ncbi:hypothetical protein GZH49_12825 [Nocardia terpenica]|uniref:hypothetical protein n=1 Tax=Nocardia terpenica TaxID=455432 RepID=UPI002FDFA593